MKIVLGILPVLFLSLAGCGPPPSTDDAGVLTDGGASADAGTERSCTDLADVVCNAACACGGCALVNDVGARVELGTENCASRFAAACELSEVNPNGCYAVVADSTCSGDALLVDGRCDFDEDECGNGIIEPPEECDPPGTNACDENCRGRPFCGDGTVDESEECDDGNFTFGDGCASCQLEYCGDGVVNNNGAEACDDGNDVDGDGCRSDCSAELCGDGIVDVGEACDDGNLVAGDGCGSTCQSEACGNGVLDVGEVCDEGQIPYDEFCNASCEIASCHSGTIETGERCLYNAQSHSLRFRGPVVAGEFDGRPGSELIVAQHPGQLARIAFDGQGIPFVAEMLPLSNTLVRGLQIRDVDGDGDDDVVVVVSNDLQDDNRVEVYLQQAGTWTSGPGFEITSYVDFDIADFDADGDPDLVLTNFANVSLYRNQGDGSFASPEVVGTDVANKVKAVDLDADGRPEIVVFSAAREEFTVYPNTDAGFAAAIELLGVGSFSSADNPLFAGDIDGDGREELVALSPGFGGALLVLQRNDEGALSVIRTASGDATFIRTFADLDGDGNRDVACNNATFYGDGNGNFTSGESIRLFGLGPSADITLPGDSAVFAWNGNGAIHVARRVAGGVTDRQRIDSKDGVVVRLDVNGDGVDDLVILDEESFAHIAGSRNFEAVPTLLPAFQKIIAGAATGDIDGDGDRDLIVQLFLEDTIKIFENDGIGGFIEHNAPSYSLSQTAIQLADIDVDGNVDIIMLVEGELRVLLHDGAYGLSFGSNTPALVGKDGLRVVDLNEDGAPDYVVQTPGINARDSRVFVALNQGDGTFASLVSVQENRNADYFAFDIGDMNGDGHLDIVVPRFEPQEDTIELLSGDGQGGFVRSDLATGFSAIDAVVIADFDSDSTSDLAVFGDGRQFVSLRYQAEALAEGTIAPMSSSFFDKAPLSLDMNADGVPDIVWIGGLANNQIMGHLRSAP